MMFNKVKEIYEKRVHTTKIQKNWYNRNVSNVMPFLKGLGVEYTTFHSDVFCLHSKELEEKLTNDMGFTTIPDVSQIDPFKDFVLYTLSNAEFNICVRLVDEKTVNAIKGAVEILLEANGSLIREAQEQVFIATLRVLLNKRSKKREHVNKNKIW